MAFVVKRAGGSSTSFMIGPVLDSTGAAVTTAVIGDFKISKNGAAPAALNGSATLTHRHTGNYSITLTSSDRDTAGWAQVTLDKTTDTCKPLDLQVVDSAIFDAFWASGANGLPAGIATSDQFSDVLEAIAVRGYTVIGDTGNDDTHLHLPSVSHPDTELVGYAIMVKEVSSANRYMRYITAWDQSDQLATLNEALPFTPSAFTDRYVILPHRQFSAIQTGDTYALANGVSGFVATKADTAAIKAKTDNLPSDPADASVIAAAFAALNDLDATEVQTAATAALTAYDPPTNAEMVARTLAAADYATSTALAAVAADLPSRITKNTAFANFPFKMVSSIDHRTAALGLTVTATRSLDGGAFGACANAVSEISDGFYKIDLASGDLNGDSVTLRFTATGADATEIVLITQPT